MSLSCRWFGHRWSQWAQHQFHKDRFCTRCERHAQIVYTDLLGYRALAPQKTIARMRDAVVRFPNNMVLGSWNDGIDYTKHPKMQVLD